MNVFKAAEKLDEGCFIRGSMCISVGGDQCDAKGALYKEENKLFFLQNDRAGNMPNNTFEWKFGWELSPHMDDYDGESWQPEINTIPFRIEYACPTDFEAFDNRKYIGRRILIKIDNLDGADVKNGDIHEIKNVLNNTITTTAGWVFSTQDVGTKIMLLADEKTKISIQPGQWIKALKDKDSLPKGTLLQIDHVQISFVQAIEYKSGRKIQIHRPAIDDPAWADFMVLPMGWEPPAEIEFKAEPTKFDPHSFIPIQTGCSSPYAESKTTSIKEDKKSSHMQPILYSPSDENESPVIQVKHHKPIVLRTLE